MTGFGSSRDEGWLPGWIFILHTISMGLDNYPIPCECGKHTYRSDIPKGLTHREDEPCPFKDDGFPIGIVGGCCWLRGKAAARELEALGAHVLALAMHQDQSSEQALVLAYQLRAFADDQLLTHGGGSSKPRGAGWSGTWDSERQAWHWAFYSTFEEAIASIREAADWYEKVGKLGFGVHAWW